MVPAFTHETVQMLLGWSKKGAHYATSSFHLTSKRKNSAKENPAFAEERNLFFTLH